MSKFVDLTGKRFGKLVVIELSYKDERGRFHWRCKCDCGKESVIAGNNLKSGNTRSCGCIGDANRELRMKEFYDEHVTHGKTNSRLHRTWRHMRERCSNPNNKDYKWYGGRGINVCEEWAGPDCFENFFKWAVSSGYDEGLTIDRIDTNGDYSPTNCKWSNATDQANNRRTNAMITINGVTKTRAEWCRERGIKYSTVVDRINSGWTPEEALEFVKHKDKRYRKSDV